MTVLISIIDQDICKCLEGVIDPELGINIVDLGLVLSATWTGGAIEVTFTLTSRACPLGAMIGDEVREALSAAFPDAESITAQLVWDPPWSQERVTEHGFELLGMKRTRTLPDVRRLPGYRYYRYARARSKTAPPVDPHGIGKPGAA